MNPQRPGVPSVPIDQLPAELPEGVTLLDVREDDEWSAGHAPGARHIPMGDVPARIEELPSDGGIYVLCRSGGRSARVTAYLNNAGWDATNVDGGMRAWQAGGRLMVAEHGETPTVI